MCHEGNRKAECPYEKRPPQEHLLVSGLLEHEVPTGVQDSSDKDQSQRWKRQECISKSYEYRIFAQNSRRSLLVTMPSRTPLLMTATAD